MQPLQGGEINELREGQVWWRSFVPFPMIQPFLSRPRRTFTQQFLVVSTSIPGLLGLGPLMLLLSRLVIQSRVERREVQNHEVVHTSN
jgi:hypothetical protein